MTEMSKQFAWVLSTTITISISLCTRVYMPERRPDLDQKCVDHMRRPNTTAAFCNDPVSIYGSPTTVRFGQVTVKGRSRSRPPLLSTFDTNETISNKYCKLRKEFGDIPFGLSIFDLECEDWEGVCNAMNTPIPGTQRFQDVTMFFATVSNLTKGQFPC